MNAALKNIFPLIIVLTILTSVDRELLAQSRSQFLFKATVVDNEFEAIGGAYIKNLRTGKHAVSDTSGYIHIQCHPEDTLLITSLGFQIKQVAPSMIIDQLLKGKNAVIQLEPIMHELKRVEIYDFKSWENFKREFAETQVEKEEINEDGLPKGEQSDVPLKYRSNEFPDGPTVGNAVVNPLSTMAYFLSAKEKEKRKAHQQWREDRATEVYQQTVVRDTVLKYLEIRETDVDPFIVYCNIHIEDKTLDRGIYYKEKMKELLPKFLESREE